jgi:hypothetical protein
MVQGMQRIEGHFRAALTGHLSDLLLGVKGESTGNWRFQILLKELALPSIPELEEHVEVALAFNSAFGAKALAKGMRDGQGGAAKSADSALPDLPYRGCSFAAHER